MGRPKKEPVDFSGDEDEENRDTSKARSFIREETANDKDNDDSNDLSSKVRFIDTQRGRKALVLDGFIYYLSSSVKQSSYFKCAMQKSKKCTATVTLKNYNVEMGTFTEVVKGIKPHNNHLPSTDFIQKREELSKERFIHHVDINSVEYRNSNHLCLFCLCKLPPGYLDITTLENVLPSGQVLSISLNDPVKNLEAFEVLCGLLNVKWRKKIEGINFDAAQCLPLCFSCQNIYQEMWQVHKQIRELERLLDKNGRQIRRMINTASQDQELENQRKTQLWMQGLHVLRRKVRDPALNMRSCCVPPEGRARDTSSQPKEETLELNKNQQTVAASTSQPKIVEPSVFVKQEVDDVENTLEELLNGTDDLSSWLDDSGAADDNSMEPFETSMSPEPEHAATSETKKQEKLVKKQSVTTRSPSRSTRASTRIRKNPVHSADANFSDDNNDNVSIPSSSDSDSDYKFSKHKSKSLKKRKPTYPTILRLPSKNPRGPGRPRRSNLRSKRFNKTNICHICDARVVGGKAYRDHYLNVHPEERRYTCKFCQKHFTHPRSVLTHQRNKHTGEKPYLCQSCPKTFASIALLLCHSRALHGEKSDDSFPCTECNNSFHSRAILNNHLIATHGHEPKTPVYSRTKKPLKPSTCHLCDAQIVGQGPFIQHYKENHPTEKRFTCKYCHRHFPYIREVLTHQRRHTGEKPSACSHCDKRFIDDRALRSHIAYYHSEKQLQFQCPICPRVYHVKQALTGHMYTHKELVVICKTCGRVFRSNHSFTKHNHREHGGTALSTKPLLSDQAMDPETLKEVGVEEVKCRRKCHVCMTPIPGKAFLKRHFETCHPDHPGDVKTCRCGKQYASYKQVFKHALRQHTPDCDKPYQCDQCPSTFVSSVELRSHTRTHIPMEQRKKDYICPVCGMGLSSPYAVAKHMKKHDGPQPRFVCEECGKDYAEKKGLQAHKSLEHLQIKPHKCPFEGCGKSFPLPSILRKHQNIHTGENKYPCPDCGKNFQYSGSLKRHMREVHNALGERGQTPRKRKARGGAGDGGTGRQYKREREDRREGGGFGETLFGSSILGGEQSAQGPVVGTSAGSIAGQIMGYPQALYGRHDYPAPVAVMVGAFGQTGHGTSSLGGIDVKPNRENLESPGGSSGY